MNIKNYIEISIAKMIEEDNFKTGCNPDTIQDFGIVATHRVKSVKEAVEYIKNNYGNPGLFGEGLLVSLLEDSEGNVASDSQVSAWKEGKLQLWNAQYIFNLEIVERSDISGDTLKDLIPGIEIL